MYIYVYKNRCVCIYIYIYMYIYDHILLLSCKLCLTLCNPMDCSPPGSSVHGISQARILEWVAISFSRESSQPRNQTHVSCLADRFFTTEPPGKPCVHMHAYIIKLPKFLQLAHYFVSGGGGGRES